MLKRKEGIDMSDDIEEGAKKRQRGELSDLSEFNVVETFKYSEESKPPFVVYVWDSSDNPITGQNNLGNFHIQKIGIKFRQYVNKLILIKQVGKEKIALTFRSFKDANDLIENISNINLNWKASIPLFKNFKVGVVLGVDPESTDVQLNEGLQSYKETIGEDNVAPIKTVRIKKKTRVASSQNEFTFENTTAVKVYFRDTELPKVATVWFTKVSIKPYVPPVRQCFKCFRLGHVKDTCNSDKELVCCKCGKEPLLKECDSDKSVCINCQGPHDAFYKDCPSKIRELQINRIRVYENVSYYEARKMIEGPNNSPRRMKKGNRRRSILEHEDSEYYDPLNQTMDVESMGSDVKLYDNVLYSSQ